MDLKAFSILTFVGSFIWDIMLVYLGYTLGPKWESILTFFDQYTYISIAAFVLVFAWLVYRAYNNRKKKSPAVTDRE